MSAAALRNSRQPEPGRAQAGVLAVLVHIAFFAFMIFGLSWKISPPEGMMVELWDSLPQPVPAAPPVPPEPPPETKEAKPSPPAQETPPPPPKPDIAIKEKPEKPKPVEKKPIEKKLQ